MKALPTSDRKYGSFSSNIALLPLLNSDMCVCMPEPFSPKSGLGMNVACQPYFIAYSLTVMR